MTETVTIPADKMKPGDKVLFPACEGTFLCCIIINTEDPYSTIAPGSRVYMRYKDHVLFKDSDASDYQPWIRETTGWLDKVDEHYVRIVWERHWDKTQQEKLRSTGLAVSRDDVLELRRVS